MVGSLFILMPWTPPPSRIRPFLNPLQSRRGKPADQQRPGRCASWEQPSTKRQRLKHPMSTSGLDTARG